MKMLGVSKKIDDIDMINSINKLLNGGFILDLCISNKNYEKEIKRIIEKLNTEYVGLVSIRRKV